MKYLCLVYVEEKKLEALSKSARAALAAEALAYDDALRKSGHYVASSAFKPLHDATTLQTRNGMLFITDGAVAAANGQLCGFLLIEAQDLNDALHVAAKIPPGRLGRIEVRAVAGLEPPLPMAQPGRVAESIDRFQRQWP